MQHGHAMMKRLLMIVREILRTCSNPHVARAAVASIGGDLAQRVSRDPAGRNLTSGIFAAGLGPPLSRAARASGSGGVDEATRRARHPSPARPRYHLEPC